MLLAYAKLSLYADLLDSNVPDDPYLGRELGRYFPKLIAQKYPDALEKHRLRREIIATQLANSMINRGGPSLVVRIADQTGALPAGIAAAFAAVRNSYDMPALNDEINALDGKLPGKVQLKGGALALVGFLARLFDMVLPSLEFFSSSPVVIRESALDASAFASYVGSVVGYAGMYTAIVLLFGLILFEDRDLA